MPKLAFHYNAQDLQGFQDLANPEYVGLLFRPVNNNIENIEVNRVYFTSHPPSFSIDNGGLQQPPVTRKDLDNPGQPPQQGTRPEFHNNELFDFAFFSRDEVVMICSLSDDVSVSGCNIRFGKGVSFDKGNQGKGFFGFKMEGDMKNFTATNIAISNSSPELPLMKVTTSMPCPPYWQSFGYMYASAMMRQGTPILDEPEMEHVAASYQAWLTFVDENTGSSSDFSRPGRGPGERGIGKQDRPNSNSEHARLIKEKEAQWKIFAQKY